MATPLRVLIVEDMEDDALLLLHELTRGGYAPTHTRVETEQAMAAALAAEPWDIVLSDYTMPLFSAPAALKLLHQCGYDIPFVVVSGNIGEEAAVEAMRAGASDYIMKDKLTRLNVVVARELGEAEQRRKRRLVEEQLVRMGRILDQSPAEIFLIEPHTWRIRQSNQTAQHHLGYAAETLARMTVLDIKPDLTSEHLAALVQPLLSAEREQITFEARHRRKDGSTYPVELRLQFSHSETTPVLIVVAQDITERKQAEETLFQEKERAQVTLQSIGDGVITTDAQARVDYMNPVAEQLTGWSLAEAKGQPLLNVFHAVHEGTRDVQECPATMALREQCIAGLASNTMLIRRDGEEFSIEDSTAPIRDRQGAVIGAVVVFHDVSHARVMANQLAYQARHDPLTGLFNRTEFEVSVRQALERAREDRKQHAVCYIDLDQFKVVNDTCGHMAGDELLKQLASRMQERVRSNDILARLGGDEFGVLLDSCPLDKAWEIADDLRATAKKFRFAWQGKTFDVGVSIGLVPLNGESVSLAEVLSAADSACYVAKDEGRNRVHVYQADDRALARHRGEMQWVIHIRQALEEDRLCLYYQTMQPLDSKAATERHIEVLLRMRAPDGQLVLPMAFIPAAERFNLMTTLDRWVIRATFDFLSHQLRNSSGPCLMTCAINLSGQSLCEDAFLDFVVAQLQRVDIQPAQICFEITETSAVTHLSRAMRFISTLKGIGCRFALDDFGSGLSSFGYLKNLPVDYLKIDGAFVKDMVDDVIDRAMVEAINNIGHVMRMQTIAEWVEGEAALALAREIGVDFAQGYAISTPQPLQDLLGA